jgi:hypothetical protein
MGTYIKVSQKIKSSMEREDLHRPVETFIKVNLKKERLMETVFFFKNNKEPFTMGIG